MEDVDVVGFESEGLEVGAPERAEETIENRIWVGGFNVFEVENVFDGVLVIGVGNVEHEFFGFAS